jgi:cytochrome c-type biogenesis protein CcmH
MSRAMTWSATPAPLRLLHSQAAPKSSGASAALHRRARWLRALLCTCLMLLATHALAQVSDPTPLNFRDAAEETRFNALTHELRCVMCQNQSLADSNAQIAHDLRREILQLMQSGQSDDQIKAYLVERYGEFVLYRPQVERGTWLLWFGPALLLVGGALVVIRVVRRRSAQATPSADDGQEW